MVVDVGAVLLALSAGAGAFFSPCAVALLPGYAAFFLGLEDEAREPSTTRAAGAGLRFGAAAAGGAAGLFALGALGVYVVRTQLDWVASAALGTTFTWAGVAVGLGLVALGGLMFADRAPRLRLPLSAPTRRTAPAMAAFGAVFALASMGCTLPIFLTIVGLALAQPALGAAAVLGAYGLGLSGLLLVGSLALALAEDWTLGKLRAVRGYVKPVSAALLVLAGLYVVNFYLEVVPLPW